MVRMNWDFVVIFKFSQSGTNQRLWDRGASGGSAVIGRKQQRVMCVRACSIGDRLPSPRALTSYIYINSKIALNSNL